MIVESAVDGAGVAEPLGDRTGVPCVEVVGSIVEVGSRMLVDTAAAVELSADDGGGGAAAAAIASSRSR